MAHTFDRRTFQATWQALPLHLRQEIEATAQREQRPLSAVIHDYWPTIWKTITTTKEG